MGVEPTSSVWKTDALTVVLLRHKKQKHNRIRPHYLTPRHTFCVASPHPRFCIASRFETRVCFAFRSPQPDRSLCRLATVRIQTANPPRFAVLIMTTSRNNCPVCLPVYRSGRFRATAYIISAVDLEHRGRNRTGIASFQPLAVGSVRRAPSSASMLIFH